jgi:hypothetical protein
MMNKKRIGTILVSALLILAAFTIAVNDVSAATSPSLGSAAAFAVLAYSKVANTGPTVVTGDVGLSPTTGAAITGFPPGAVIGTIYAVDAAGPAGSVNNPGLLTTAKTDLSIAYTVGLGSQACDITYPGAFKDLVGESLVPGVYCATAFTLSGTLTLQGSGVWIFKSTSTLITSGTANVVGGDPCNVWWWVASSATLGTNTALIGNILAYASITLATGASLNGRALAQNEAVTLDTNRVTVSICVPITTVTTTAFTTIYTTTIDNTDTVITTLTTIIITITIFSPIPSPIAVAVGGEILPVDTSQLLGFVAILIAAAAIGLVVMYKRRIR